MGIIKINELMKILNKRLNELISFKKEFKVFLQEGGVGCYDAEKWAIFVPDSFDTQMKIRTILHEGAHLILREKIHLISPNKFDRLKWCMEPFFIDNSIFTLDEVFAEIITRTITFKLPNHLFKKEIIFDKRSKQSYKGSDKNLYMFLAKISNWKIPIALKNHNLNIANCLNNITFLEPKKRIEVILNSFSSLEDINYKSFIKKILNDPFKNSPAIFLSSKINKNLEINQEFKEFDIQIFLDYLEVISWLNYTENYHMYDKYLNEKNSQNLEKKRIVLNKDFRKKLLGISKNLKNIRKNIINSWKTKDKKNLKKFIEKYNEERWKYRKKIDLNNNFNKFGFGEFKWE